LLLLLPDLALLVLSYIAGLQADSVRYALGDAGGVLVAALALSWALFGALLLLLLLPDLALLALPVWSLLVRALFALLWLALAWSVWLASWPWSVVAVGIL